MNRRDALRSLLTLPTVGSVAVTQVTEEKPVSGPPVIIDELHEHLRPIQWTHLGPSNVKGLKVYRGTGA